MRAAGILGLVLLFCVQLCSAQEDTTSKGFFAAKKFRSSAYVQASVSATQWNKGAGAITALSLNWVVNEKFVSTAYFHILSSNEKISPCYGETGVNCDQVPLTHMSAGGGFGYILFPNKKFSLQPELMGGWANAKYSTNDTTTFKANFGMIQPGVNGIWNASKFIRIGIGVNYRMVVGREFRGLNFATMSGIAGLFFIRIGKF